MGYVLSAAGAPLANKPVEVKNVATGGLVQSGATNTDGRWEFTMADDAQQYKVEIGAGAGSPQKVVQAPASIELEYLYVRYGADLPAGTTIGGAPVAGQFVLKTGDTMTGNLTLDAAQPTVFLRESDAPVDNRRMAFSQPSGDGRLRIQALNDAGAGGANILDITRVGNELRQFRFGLNSAPLIEADVTVPSVTLRGATSVTAGGLNIAAPGVITATGAGHRIGVNTAGAANGAVTRTDAAIVFHDGGADYWTGIGTDGNANLWLRGAGASSTIPALRIDPAGVVIAQRNQVVAEQGLSVQRSGQPTQGQVYFGNSGARWLLWDTGRLRVQDMPLTVMTTGAAGSGSLAVQGNVTSDVSIAVYNDNSSYTGWHFAQEGSRAAIAPNGGLSINNSGYGTAIGIRPGLNDLRVGIGAGFVAAPGAQLDVQANQSSFASFRAIARADHAAFTVFAAFVNEGGVPIIGASRSGVVCDAVAGGGPSTYAGVRMPVYSNAGTLRGYILLYNP
jgi:hypothetical protein